MKFVSRQVVFASIANVEVFNRGLFKGCVIDVLGLGFALGNGDRVGREINGADVLYVGRMEDCG